MSFDAEKLGKPLDRARVKTRAGGSGGALSYIETHDAIRTANEIFGFGKWGHRVTELRCLGNVTVHGRDGKAGIQVGYLCAVELNVAGCETTSGVGYGDAVEYRESGPVTAHELAAKEAESDALKRALKNYGDQFGLALYDKDQAHVVGEPATNGNGGNPAPRQQPTSTSGDNATEKQIQFLRRLMSDNNISDVGKSPDELSKGEASQLIEQIKAGTFAAPSGEHETLAALGAGVDDDVPFMPTMDAVL